jgi:DNA polymerase-3 subunit alpha
MIKQNRLLKPTKIETIEIINLEEEVDLLDIEVEDDHTFFISNDCNNWILTHNCGAPDIDVDLGDRDAVIDVLRKEFGYNNVIPISNYNQFKVKSLVKDLARFYAIPYEEVNEATKTVEQDVRKATQKHGDDKNLFVLTFDDAMKYSISFKLFIDKYPQIAESMNVLFKEQRSLGRHAGGVCILDDALADMPLIVNSGEPQTPWVEGVGSKTLEPLGIIKYDLLGLETMRLISDTIGRILKNKVEKVNIELEDGRILSLFSTQKVKTNNGEKLAKDLTESDEIVDI